MICSKALLFVPAVYVCLTLGLLSKTTAQDLHPNYTNDNNNNNDNNSKFLRTNNLPKISRRAQTTDIQWFASSYEDLTLPRGSTLSFSNVGLHNLLKFATETHFNNCDFSGATFINPQMYTNSGSDEVAYFGCAVGSHCSAMNQKIKITFEGSTDSPTAIPTMSPTMNLTVSPTMAISSNPSKSPTGANVIAWGVQSYDPIVMPHNSSIEFINQGPYDLQIMESFEKFESCDFSGATLVDPQIYENDGKDETVYFACSIGAHCGFGMKVEVMFNNNVDDMEIEEEEEENFVVTLVQMITAIFPFCFM